MMKKLYILTAMLMLSLVPVMAQDVSRQESRKAKLEREIALLDEQLAQNASKSSALLSNLELLRKNIENRKALVKESEREIRRYNDSLYLKQLAINRLQARVDTLTSHYSRLVKSAYKNRDSRVWYMYILASDNLGQAYRRFGYFRNLSTRMKEEAVRIKAMKEELEVEKTRLAQLRKDAERVKAARVKELEKLRKDETAAANTAAKLKKEKKKYEAELKAKRKEVQALNKEIQRIIAEATKPKSPSGGGKVSQKDDPAAIALSAEFSANKGKLPWPVNGSVVAKFGKQYHSVFKNLELPANNGLDIAAPKGSQIKAVFNGTVKQVFVMPGYNQCVLVQHGKNYFTFYCKLGSVNVKAGDKVTTGQVLGTMETQSGNNQIHFELWKDSKPQNPEGWLR
ncbi:MAG: peptidoglycan DD-metalloendopeptidase family protein [Bacteroidales bacterium]|nr:peptidoglycan DD-metalloendopeptidase family protein [Bacteroidales bacterium]